MATRVKPLRQVGEQINRHRHLAAAVIILIFAFLGSDSALLFSGLGCGHFEDTYFHQVAQPLLVISVMILGLLTEARPQKGIITEIRPQKDILAECTKALAISIAVVSTGKGISEWMQHVSFEYLFESAKANLEASRRIHSGICFLHYSSIGWLVWLRPKPRDVYRLIVVHLQPRLYKVRRLAW